MSFKKFGFIAAALSLVVTSIFTLGAQAAPEPKSVYIVKFVDNASVRNEVATAKRNGIDVTNVLEFAFKGFIGEMTAAQAQALSKNPQVDFVEAEREVSIDATQSGATWGLDRIDQTGIPLSSTYSYSSNLDKDNPYASDGTGVRAYVIDTGILPTHSEFTGRLDRGVSYVNDSRGTTDCNGHGTHVAGTIGGTLYGVAKKVTLIPVRVLNCRGSGYNTWVVRGIDWAISDALLKGKPAVANLSLGSSLDSSLDNAVLNLVNNGMTVAVAAGNSTANACNFSPAREPSALTVGATTSTDSRASYSNFGSCVDIYAPGSSITSAGIKSSTSTATMSGTSMASPHVAGLAARYLSEYPLATPEGVATAILKIATRDKITNIVDGPEDLLLFAPYRFKP